MLNGSAASAIHAVEIAATTLTLFNVFAAGLTAAILLLDNHRQWASWWKLSWERRMPFYLAVSVILSHTVFATREFVEMGSFIPGSTGTSATYVTPTCVALNESSWWGMSLILWR
jgi:hypothetical protein